MKTYTIIAYVLPAGAHHVEESDGIDPSDAAIRLRNKLELKREEFEIVAIAPGKDPFISFDHRDLALAPFTGDIP